VSPFSPYGPTLALLFVLGAGAVKALVADAKRHKEDRETNNSKCTVMEPTGAAFIPFSFMCVSMRLHVCDSRLCGSARCSAPDAMVSCKIWQTLQGS
jgi:hypothetical protein